MDILPAKVHFLPQLEASNSEQYPHYKNPFCKAKQTCVINELVSFLSGHYLEFYIVCLTWRNFFFVCSFWRPPMYWEPQWRLAALTDYFRAVVVVAVVATSNNAVTSSSLLLAKRSTRRACLLKRPSLFLHCYDLLLLCYFYYHQHSFLVYRPFFMNDTI